MRKIFQKTAIILVLVMTALQIAACSGAGGAGGGSSSGGSGTSNSGSSEDAGTYDCIYTVKPIPIGEELMTGISGMHFLEMREADGKICALAASYTEFGLAEQILRFAPDGSGLEAGDILSIMEGEYVDAAFDGSGNLYVLRVSDDSTGVYGPGQDSGFDEADENYDEGPADGEELDPDVERPDLEAAREREEEGAEEESEESEGPDLENSVEVVEGPGGAPSEEYTAVEVEEVDLDTPDSVPVQTSSYKLFCYEPDGAIVWETPLGGEEDLYFASQIACAGDVLVINDTNGLCLYSAEDGSFISVLSTDDELAGCSIFGLPDERVAVWTYGGNGQEIRVFPVSGGEPETYPIAGTASFTSIFPGSGYALYLAADKGIYGMNLDGSEPVKVLDYLDSDMDILSVDTITELADGRFVTAMVNEQGDTELSLLTKVDPETAANRTVLTLGCYYIDYEVRREVLAFNKTSESVRIRIKDYSDFDSSTGSEGLTRLNTDIASGNSPDILLLSYAMPLRSYVSKGVLEDLTPYFEKDGELQESSFLTNVFDAFRTDGKMYTIVPSFYVMTLVGRTSDIGSQDSFTLDKVSALTKERGADPQKVFGLAQRDILLYNALELCGERFLDWENSTCRFNGEEFISLLEFLQPFPAKLGEADTMVDTTADYRNGTSLFYMCSLGSFEDYIYIRHGMFGEDITMTGFPSLSGAEAAISPQMQIAVSSSAKDKEGAWSFVRRFLLPGYQSKINYYYWPVNESALDSLAAAAQEPHYYEDGNGGIQEEHVVVSIGGEMLELPRLSREEADEIKEFLKGLDQAVYIDSAVENIITEEADAFFAGQKSAKDVADVIQSRVQIYINENS